MRTLIIFTLAVGMFCPAMQAQQPTVTISPGTNAASSVTLLVDGRYDVALQTSHSASPTTFTVAGGSNTRIRNVNVNATGSNTTIIHIHGSTSASSIAEVEAIDRLTSTSLVALYATHDGGCRYDPRKSNRWPGHERSFNWRLGDGRLRAC